MSDSYSDLSSGAFPPETAAPTKGKQKAANELQLWDAVQAEFLEAFGASIPQGLVYVMERDKKRGKLAARESPMLPDIAESDGEHSVAVALAIHQDVLKALVAGNFPAIRHTLGSLLPNPQQEWNRRPIGRQQHQTTTSRPIIYGLFLVDENGNSPEWFDWSVVLEHLEQYLWLGDPSTRHTESRFDVADTRKFCSRIDEANAMQPWKAQPRTVEGQTYILRYLDSPYRVDSLRKFIISNKRRLGQRSDTDPDEAPIPGSVAYVGWTWQPEQRRKQHLQHTSSHPLVDLVYYICATLFEDKYEIVWSILYECSHARESEVAQHIISHAAHSYVEYGGFNNVAGGNSNKSSDSIEAWVYAAVGRKLRQQPWYIARSAKAHRENQLRVAASKEEQAQLQAAQLKGAYDEGMQAGSLTKSREYGESLQKMLGLAQEVLMNALETYVELLEDWEREEEELRRVNEELRKEKAYYDAVARLL